MPLACGWMGQWNNQDILKKSFATRDLPEFFISKTAYSFLFQGSFDEGEYVSFGNRSSAHPYRSFQANTRFAALFEIHKIDTRLHRSKLKNSAVVFFVRICKPNMMFYKFVIIVGSSIVLPLILMKYHQDFVIFFLQTMLNSTSSSRNLWDTVNLP